MHVVATAGHVDHGKSTLVRALTGMEPDRLAEERRRGMTIDLGFAWTTSPSGHTIAFVDVPGHERFVTTMLAGVGPTPAVLLVVAADEGWMPQTAEHVDVLDAMGVRDGLLVITRSDLLDPYLAHEEAREHLRGTSLAGLPAVCVSAATGAGMDELRAALDTLVSGLPAPDAAADVRMWIDRAFTVRGAGTVVTGTLAEGTVGEGAALELATPHGRRRVRVRALQSLGETVGEAGGACRLAVNVRGLQLDAVSRGDALLAPDAWLDTDLVDVRLHHLRADPAGLPAELTLHVGSAAVGVAVRPLGAGAARLRLRRALPLRIGDRAVLRDPGRRRVIAGLTVLDVRPPLLRRRGAAAARAAQLVSMDAAPSAAAELARRRTARATDLRAMGVTDLGTLTGAPAAGGWSVDPAHALALAAELAAAVTTHDAADPMDPGLPVDAACRILALPEPHLVEAIVAQRTTGLAVREGRVVMAATGAAPSALEIAMSAVRDDLRRTPFAAPESARLAELGLGPRQISALVKAGELIRIADGVVLLPGTDIRALEILAGLGPEFTVSGARQALGTTRRVAVPLLEFLAAHGRTRRAPGGGHQVVRGAHA